MNRGQGRKRGAKSVRIAIEFRRFLPVRGVCEGCARGPNRGFLGPLPGIV
jgi:hypothetical protein